MKFISDVLSIGFCSDTFICVTDSPNWLGTSLALVGLTLGVFAVLAFVIFLMKNLLVQ